MTSSQNTGLQLLYADTEEAVTKIIAGDSAMSDNANWHPLDNRDTNFNIVTNQSSSGAKAATEIITNMVDAVLTKRCREKDINPISSQAPQTMYKAVDQFIQNLNGGKIINADDKWLRKYAEENLVIGLTGGKQGPSYTFCDNGEGQHPKNFPNTFLSLSSKYKSQIPFVQGKYNMGSSGVLNFCGNHWYKLIVSRRYDKTGHWGWTLVRKRPGSIMPCADYFAIDGPDGIQTVDTDDMVPFRTDDGSEFDQFSLQSGTIVKLYEYYMGANYVSFRMTREAFNENLVETILPFRLLDFRQKRDPSRGGLRALGIDARPFYGMEYQVARSHQEDHEDGHEDEPQLEGADEQLLHVGTVNDPELGEITITAAVLKKKAEKVGWIKHSKYRIFHHVNGQAHYKEKRGVLTQCALPALKDRVVIFVDASRLSSETHQSIWKGDREHITETRLGEDYKTTVQNIIRNSSELKEWNHRIAKEELDSAAKDGSRELVRELVGQDDNLASLLDSRVPHVDIGGAKMHGQSPLRSDLKISPTYIKLRQGNPVIELPINRSRPIPCDTDVMDDYFTRPANRGYHVFSDDAIANNFVVNHRLKNGDLMFFMRPAPNTTVGQEFRFQIGLKDDGMPLAVNTEKELMIRIVDHFIPSTKPKPHPKPKPKTRQVGLPPHKLLTKDGREIEGTETIQWEKFELTDFNEKDGGYVKETGEGSMYYINYDNAWFQNYLQSKVVKDRREEISEKYILGMRITLLGMEHAINNSGTTSEGMQENEDIFRRLAAKGAAAIVMTLCDQLPKHFDLFTDDGSDGE